MRVHIFFLVCVGGPHNFRVQNRASMSDARDLGTLATEAKTALEAVTAQDPRHLKTLHSYLNAIEGRYAALLDELTGDDGYDEDDDDEDDTEDPENPDADIIYNTRDFHEGGITTTFQDAPSQAEGKVSQVLLFPVFYEKGLEAFDVYGFTHKTSSRDPNKPGKLILDYGTKLAELQKDPAFRGFKVYARMESDDEDDDGQDE